MTEDFLDDGTPPPAFYARGEIAALETIVEAILMELPDRAMENVERTAYGRTKDLRRQARELPNDARRDLADGFEKTVRRLCDRLDERRFERAEGAYVPTIQPASGDDADR